MGYNVLDRVTGVNRLKRGGSLFEGVVQREMEVYIFRRRCVRSGLPSSGWIPNVGGCSQPRNTLDGVLRNGTINRPTRYSERSFHSRRFEDEHVNGESVHY